MGQTWIVPISMLVSFIVPIIFLGLLYKLDVYASCKFALVIACFLWGAIGSSVLAYYLNNVALPFLCPRLLGKAAFVGVIIPTIEELLKSLAILYVARRSEFTYFVDGAIYGFATGIGFAISENLYNVTQYPDQSLPIAMLSVLSTNLMHGTAAGLVGVAVGRMRFQKRVGKGLGLLGGWIAAITLHGAFNAVTQSRALTQALQTPICVGIGLAGLGLIALFISLGLSEQKQWIGDTLDRRVGVTGGEARAAQSYDKLEELLEPITMQFPQKTEQVMALVLCQAQLGIKRKVQERLEDSQQKSLLAQEIEQLQTEMEQLRKAIGPYVMTYVRSVFPEGTLNPWARMDLVAAQTGPADVQKWAKMIAAPRDNDATATPRRSIFGQLNAQSGHPTDEEPK